MRQKFTCQVVTSNGGIRRIHFVADDGVRRADVFMNIPYDWFELDEEPREHHEYRLEIRKADEPAPPTNEQKN